MVRTLLATAEVAATVTLGVCALVLVQTMARFAAVDMGVRPDEVMTLRVTLPLGRYGSPEKSAAFQDALLDALAGVSAVTASSTSSVMPGSAEVGVGFRVSAEGFPAPKDQAFPRFASVSPGYFETMGIRLGQGRRFTRRDGRDAARVAILSEDAVRLLFPPDVDPLGRHVVVASPQPVSREIVGIVGDVRMRGPEAEGTPMIYVPIAQQPPIGTTYLALRAGNHQAALAAATAAIRRLDPMLPPYDVRPLRALTDATIADRRFAMLVMMVFAVITLALAMVGLHGVIGHLVEERRRDIGIRAALGADRRRIYLDVLSKGLRHGLVVVANRPCRGDRS